MFTLLSTFSYTLLWVVGAFSGYILVSVLRKIFKVDVVDQVSDIKQVPLDSIKDFTDSKKVITVITEVEPVDTNDALYAAMHEPINSINSPVPTKPLEGVYEVHMKPLVPEEMTKPTTKAKVTVQTKYSGPKYSRINTKDVAKFMRLNQVSNTPNKLTESELNAILKDIANMYRSTKESPYIFYSKESMNNIAQAIGFKSHFILSEYLKGAKVSKNNKDLIELYFKNNVKNYILAPTGITKSDNAPEQK